MRLSVVPCLLSLLPVMACTDGKGLPCDTSASGDLEVSIVASASASASAFVRVYGPDGAVVAEVTEGELLSELPGGAYTYEVIRAWDGTTSVGALDLGAGEVCIGGGTTSVEVAVDAQPGSGALWASTWENLLVLPATPGADSLSPDVQRTLGATNSINALAADASGNLWAATPWTYGARFVVLAPGALSGTGAASPDLEVSAPSLAGNANFTGLSFDADGNLWATTGMQMGGFVGVVGWSADVLRAARVSGGALEAEPDWAVTVDGVVHLSGGTVDADGDLWATAEDDEALLRIARADLMSGTAGVDAAPAVSPAVRMRLVDAEDGVTPWRGLTSVVEASTGGLYVLAATTGAIVSVPAGSLDDSGDVGVDALQLGVTALPNALAADGDGGVWFVDSGSVGYLAAGADSAEVSEVTALERAGALYLDVQRQGAP
jgi:sugar lactone lactonase YvrE